MDHHVRTSCRLCGGLDLKPALSLVATPPANAFASSATASSAQTRYPLTLRLCGDCGHLQLVDIVDPEVLFRDYVYVSGTSPSFVAHFKDYAAAIADRVSLNTGDLVVDIGSNDGTFLRMFQEYGCSVLGIDPAEKIAATANANGIETKCAFFDAAMATDLRRDRGAAKVVSANNVFAHIDDLTGVAEGIRILLADDGMFVFEVSYLVDVFKGTLFDTIYHEHLDYHRIGPLKAFFARLGMSLVDAERVASHGGSLRGYARVGSHSPSPALLALETAETELGLDDPETFVRFQHRIETAGRELSSLLSGLLKSGKKIAAYGAPAKATTLMHQFGLDDTTISYVIDDSPWKQGLFTPGLGLPVVTADILERDPPDYLVILAWNFSDPIMQKNTAFTQRGGRFIVPLPNLSVHGT